MRWLKLRLLRPEITRKGEFWKSLWEFVGCENLHYIAWQSYSDADSYLSIRINLYCLQAADIIEKLQDSWHKSKQPLVLYRCSWCFRKSIVLVVPGKDVRSDLSSWLTVVITLYKGTREELAIREGFLNWFNSQSRVVRTRYKSKRMFAN